MNDYIYKLTYNFIILMMWNLIGALRVFTINSDRCSQFYFDGTNFPDYQQLRGYNLSGSSPIFPRFYNYM